MRSMSKRSREIGFHALHLAAVIRVSLGDVPHIPRTYLAQDRASAAVTAPDTGTNAALQRLGAHELQLSTEVDELKVKLKLLRATAEPEGDEAQRVHLNQISQTIEQISELQENWIKAVRALREMDKAVPKSARDGEKISVEEAREAFAQLQLSIFLGVESFILQISGDALRCNSEEEFHSMCATKIRDCVKGQLEVAKREEALPAWVL